MKIPLVPTCLPVPSPVVLAGLGTVRKWRCRLPGRLCCWAPSSRRRAVRRGGWGSGIVPPGWCRVGRPRGIARAPCPPFVARPARCPARCVPCALRFGAWRAAPCPARPAPRALPLARHVPPPLSLARLPGRRVALATGRERGSHATPPHAYLPDSPRLDAPPRAAPGTRIAQKTVPPAAGRDIPLDVSWALSDRAGLRHRGPLSTTSSRSSSPTVHRVLEFQPPHSPHRTCSSCRRLKDPGVPPIFN